MAAPFMDVFALLEGEFGGIKEAEEVKKHQKTQSEVDALTLSDSLSDTQKLLHLVQKGNATQQASATAQFRRIASRRAAPLTEPSMRESVEGFAAAAQSAEVPAIQRAALLDALSESLDSGAVSLVLHTSVVLPVALRLYLKPKQEDVFDAIVRLFVRCVRLVPLDVLVKEVLPSTLASGNVSSTDERRVSCCHLLGAISSLKHVPLDIITPLVEPLSVLCQDTVSRVRQAAAEQIPVFLKRLPEPFHSACFTELMELVNDEEASVKVAAVTAAIASLPFVPQGLRRSRMLPTLRSMFQTVCSRNLSLSSSSASGGPTVRPTLGFATPITSSAAGILSPTAATRKAEAMLKCLAAQFGLVVSHCIKLGDFNTTGLLLTSTGVSQRRGSFLLMDPRHTEDSAEDEAADSSDAAAGSRTEVDDKSKRRTDLMLLSLLRFFSSLVSHVSIEIRVNCCTHLPLLSSMDIPEVFDVCVLPSLSRLSSDVSISVRQALAGVLHSLFRYRSQKPGGTAALLTILSRLLQDEEDCVVNAVIVHLDSMLVMSVGGKDTGLGSAGAVEIPAMSTQLLTLSVKNLLRHDWRRQLALFRCLRVIQLLQDNESLASETVALCHQSIEQGVEPVRKAAVATLVWMCRYGPRGSVRKMAEELLFLIPHSSLWTIRCLALHSIGCSLWMFSRSFVKAKFLPLLADIMKDPVSLVRERCLHALVGLRRWFTFPRDVQAITLLEESARLCFTDLNPRLAELASKTFTEINTFQDLRTPSGSHTTEVAGFTPHSMSFGLRDLLYGMCDEAIDSAPVTDFSIWSEVFAWADVQSEDALLLPVPEPEDSPFFANPYQLTFTVDSAMLTDVPTLRMSVAAPHLSTEESRRVTAEEALVVAALQEDDMENRRLVEERRAEVRRLTEPPAAKPAGGRGKMPPVAPISTGTPSTGALLARPTKAPDGKSVSRDRVPTLPTGLHSLPSQGTVLGFSSADSSTLSSRVSSIKPLVGDAGPLRTSTTNDLSASMGSPVVDSGFILGVHRPKGGPRLSATRLSAPPARMSSLDDPLAVSLDTGVRLMGDVEQTSVAEPSGSIMPPIGGRRKVGVLSLSTKRTAVPTVDPTVSPTPSTQSISVLGATRPLGRSPVRSAGMSRPPQGGRLGAIVPTGLTAKS